MMPQRNLYKRKITTQELLKAIRKLPSDDPIKQKGVWYLTQKEHWLGWLEEYSGPGAYKRQNWDQDAKFAYNHVVCPELLLYLIQAIPLEEQLIIAANQANKSGSTQMERSGAIRKVVPWEMIYKALWGH